jgi:hypothetical protein
MEPPPRNVVEFGLAGFFCPACSLKLKPAGNTANVAAAAEKPRNFLLETRLVFFITKEIKLVII